MSLLIEFNEAHSEGQAYVMRRLREELGLQVLQGSPHSHHVQVSCSCTDMQVLEREADRQRMMLYNKKGLLQEFELTLPRSHFQRCNEATGSLFTPSQSNFLLLCVIEHLSTDEEFVRRFQSSKEGEEAEAPGEELLETCSSLGIVRSYFPPQHPDPASHLQHFHRAMYAWRCDRKVIAEMNEHFGSEVALYLAFMDHLTLWLAPPACFGLFIYAVNYLDEDMDVNNNLMIPLFSIFVITWAVLFVQYFRRTCCGLACEWGLLGRGLKRDSGTKVRSDFKGRVVVSRVTGRKELVFEWYRRIPYYLLSMLVTSMMLLVAFAVMVVSLNLQGYIHEFAMGAKLLHFPSISVHSQPGAIFDNKGGGPYGMVLPFVPVVLHALVIMLLNTAYRHVAEFLTALENHRTDDNFRNSLLIKRIFFEAFDCYIALFYLAFCQFDIVALRTDLFGLYTVDSIRRLATETVLPHLMHLWEGSSATDKSKAEKVVADVDRRSKKKKSGGKGQKAGGKRGPDVSIEKTGIGLPENVAKQFILDEYDNFDDFLEMVISFGYITLFASAFPLASTLTLFCVILETKSDIFKLFWISRKPNPRPTVDIGTWTNILMGLAWISVITNVFLFAFTTEQMMQIFPSFFQISESQLPSAVDDEAYTSEYATEDRQHDMVASKRGIVWGYCFCIEHVLLLLAGLVTIMVPERPAWVVEELQRQEYVKDQESRQLHRLTLCKDVTAKKED